MRAHLWLNNFNSMFSQRNSLILFYLFEFEQNVRSCTCWCNIQNIRPGDKMKRDFSLIDFLINKKNHWMKKVVKQVVGIDVAQAELVVCFGKMDEDCSQQINKHIF